MRKIAGEENPADLYTKHLESNAKIEQLVGLFGAEFRDGRPAAAPQLRADPVAAEMAGVMVSAPGPEPGFALMLPHLMDATDMDDLYEIVKIDEGDNSEWTEKLRPAEELSDPGPDGRLDFTPALHRDGALTIQTVDDGDATQQLELTERENDYPKNDSRKQGKVKRVYGGLRGEQECLIDEGTNRDGQYTEHGEVASSTGGRSRWRGSQHFSRSLRPNFVKADEHPRGHPQRHCVRTNSSLACHRSYGCARSSLSIARSVGECLDDMSICGMHARSCIDRCRAVHMHSQVEAEHSQCEHAQAWLMHHGTNARAYHRPRPSVAQGLLSSAPLGK